MNKREAHTFGARTRRGMRDIKIADEQAAQALTRAKKELAKVHPAQHGHLYKLFSWHSEDMLKRLMQAPPNKRLSDVPDIELDVPETEEARRYIRINNLGLYAVTYDSDPISPSRALILSDECAGVISASKEIIRVYPKEISSQHPDWWYRDHLPELKAATETVSTVCKQAGVSWRH